MPAHQPGFWLVISLESYLRRCISIDELGRAGLPGKCSYWRMEQRPAEVIGKERQEY